MSHGEHPLSSLRWTTRSEVCSELLRFLMHTAAEAPRPDPNPGPQSGLREAATFSLLQGPEPLLRSRAANLFALLAEVDHIPVLRQLHLDPQANWNTMDACRSSLARLSVDELKCLFDREHGLVSEDLIRTPKALATARQVMEGWNATERAWALTRIGWYESLRPLADWLYERWLNEDRWQLEDTLGPKGPVNRTVAWYTAKSMHLKRLESTVILLDYWRRSAGEPGAEPRAYVWDFDAGVPAAWVADHPDELRELAESFTLMPADLVNYYGEERLLQIVEEKLRDISRQLRADPDDDSPLFTREFKRVVWILADWPQSGVSERIRSLLACQDIDTEVRWRYCDNTWKRRHEDMSALVLAAGKLAADRKLAVRVLRWLADEPEPTDRLLFRWAAFEESDWELAYWALQGLEQLGETGEAWHKRLHELSRSAHPFLCLQATGALARRGDWAGLEEIARTAVQDDDPCVQGEAIRVLGQLGSVRHLDLIQEALWAEGPIFEEGSETFVPVAEEAALALGRIGTPEAMTALIQGFLFLPESQGESVRWAQYAAREALEVLIGRMDGSNRRFILMPSCGWRWSFFKPWPEPSFKLAE